MFALLGAWPRPFRVGSDGCGLRSRQHQTARRLVQQPPSGLAGVQLGLGIICLVMIANLQYGWTLFIDPIDAKHHWGRAAIQVAFTIRRTDHTASSASI